MSTDPPPPQLLPYADRSVPAGVDDVQVFRIGHELRRVTVPAGVSFEVTPFAFRLTRADVLGTHHAAWPRSALTEVKVNRYNGRLVLRLAGQDPLEVDVGSPVMAERVLHELIASMTVIPVAPPGRQAVRSDEADGLPPSPLRSLLSAVAVALMGLGVLCLFVPPHVLGCYVFLAAAVPAGLAFGTQRKDLWP